jgi:hypothetical protein
VSLAISRGPISRYVKGRLPRRLWVLGLPEWELEEHRLFGPWSVKVLVERPPAEGWGSSSNYKRRGALMEKVGFWGISLDWIELWILLAWLDEPFFQDRL